MTTLGKVIISIVLLLVLSISILIYKSFKPEKLNLSPSSLTTNSSYSRKAEATVSSTIAIDGKQQRQENNIKVISVELGSSENIVVPKESLSNLQQAFLTDDKRPNIDSVKSTHFKTNKELFLVIESSSDQDQNADVFVQRINSSAIQIKYKILIGKGMGSLSLGTNLPEGNYRLILTSGKKGYTVTFKVN